MITPIALFLISVGYLLTLFAIAHIGDRNPQFINRHKQIIVSLSIAINLSAWSFYGTTAQAVELGWYIPPTFVGGALLIGLAFPFLKRLVRVSKEANITSIADFIASRHGKSQALAITVTLVALVCLVPYVALQLKAVAVSFDVLTDASASFPMQRELAPVWRDTALLTALLLAVFAIMFGTRHIDSSEHHNGMMLAIAFESIVKIFAFMCIGYYAAFHLFGGIEQLLLKASVDPNIQNLLASRTGSEGYLAAVILGMASLFCLPRQFHVLVVESRDPEDITMARWMFPLYMLGMCIPLLPIGYAGVMLLQDAGISPEHFVLALPMLNDSPGLTLLAYIGGLSAGSSMVIVASVALATMICNEVVMPLLLHKRWAGIEHRSDMTRLVRLIRRASILVLLLLSYSYYRLLGNHADIGSTGLLAFGLIIQIAPAALGGLYWRRATAGGAIAGIIGGIVICAFTLLLPVFVRSGLMPEHLLTQGLFGLAWLRPESLFAIPHIDPVSNGVLWSLVVNVSLYLLISLRSTMTADYRSVEAAAPPGSIRMDELTTLAARFIGTEQAQRAVLSRRPEVNDSSEPGTLATRQDVEYIENLLAGVIGASSAKHVIEIAVHKGASEAIKTDELLEETSQVFQFSRDLLQSSINNISQGISVVDRNFRLVAWNSRYLELLNFPENMIYVGAEVSDLVRYSANRGDCGPGETEFHVKKRLDHLRRGTEYCFQRNRSDGKVIEIKGQPMPGGGFVTTYTDITDYHTAVHALEEAKQSLEQRVSERTAELTEANEQLIQAKSAAEQANRSKTRFLAEAGHDLIQPLHSSRLFIATLLQRIESEQDKGIVTQLSRSMESAEVLINELLDIAKIDAGAVVPELHWFDLAAIFNSLNNDFQALASQRGIRLQFVASSVQVWSDPALLRRVLQNLVSNAIRYTTSGKVLIGCRRRSSSLEIQICDTGIGIAEADVEQIFVEFHRVEQSREQSGHGLGLATVQRLCRLLDHEIVVQSSVGQGSVFGVRLPYRRGREKPAVAKHDFGESTAAGLLLDGLNILSVENEPAVANALELLLQEWGCLVTTCLSPQAALALEPDYVPDIILADYHLEAEMNGVELIQSICNARNCAIPAILLSADRTGIAKHEAHTNGFIYLSKPVKAAALRASLNRVALKKQTRVASG